MSKGLELVITAISKVNTGFANGLKDLVKFKNGVLGVFSGVWDALKKFTGFLLGIGAAVATFMGLAVREAMKVNDAMEQLNAVLATTQKNSGLTADGIKKARVELQALIPVAEEVAIAIQTAFLASGRRTSLSDFSQFALVAAGLAKQSGDDVVDVAKNLAKNLDNLGSSAKFLRLAGATISANDELILKGSNDVKGALEAEILFWNKLNTARELAVQSGKGLDAALAKTMIAIKGIMSAIGARAIEVLKLEDFFSNLSNGIARLSSSKTFIDWVDKNVKALIPFKTLLEGIIELGLGNKDIGEMKIQAGIQGITKTIVDALMTAGKWIGNFLLDYAPMIGRAMYLGLLGKIETAEELQAWLETKKTMTQLGKQGELSSVKGRYGRTAQRMHEEKMLAGPPSPTFKQRESYLPTEAEVTARIREEDAKISDRKLFILNNRIAQVGIEKMKLQQALFNPPSVFYPETENPITKLLGQIDLKLDSSPNGDPNGIGRNVVNTESK